MGEERKRWRCSWCRTEPEVEPDDEARRVLSFGLCRACAKRLRRGLPEPRRAGDDADPPARED